MAEPMISAVTRTVVLGLAVLTIAACTRDEPLEQRVADYWKARMERNVEAAYQYEHPEVRGDETGYHARVGAAHLLIKEVTVDDVTVDGDRAIAHLSVEYRHAAMSRNVKTKITDEWERSGSRWYHRPPPPMPSRAAGAAEIVVAPTPKDD